MPREPEPCAKFRDADIVLDRSSESRQVHAVPQTITSFRAGVAETSVSVRASQLTNRAATCHHSSPMLPRPYSDGSIPQVASRIR